MPPLIPFNVNQPASLPAMAAAFIRPGMSPEQIAANMQQNSPRGYDYINQQLNEQIPGAGTPAQFFGQRLQSLQNPNVFPQGIMGDILRQTQNSNQIAQRNQVLDQLQQQSMEQDRQMQMARNPLVSAIAAPTSVEGDRNLLSAQLAAGGGDVRDFLTRKTYGLGAADQLPSGYGSDLGFNKTLRPYYDATGNLPEDKARGRLNTEIITDPKFQYLQQTQPERASRLYSSLTGRDLKGDMDASTALKASQETFNVGMAQDLIRNKSAKFDAANKKWMVFAPTMDSAQIPGISPKAEWREATPYESKVLMSHGSMATGDPHFNIVAEAMQLDARRNQTASQANPASQNYQPASIGVGNVAREIGNDIIGGLKRTANVGIGALNLFPALMNIPSNLMYGQDSEGYLPYLNTKTPTFGTGGSPYPNPIQHIRQQVAGNPRLLQLLQNDPQRAAAVIAAMQGR